MVQITKVNSGGEYEARYSYSRLVMVDDWIFTANSAGVVPETGELPSDPVEQARQTLDNLEHALRQVGSDLTDVVRMVVRIPKRENIFKIMDYVGPRFAGIEPARSMVCTPLGSEAYALEIELTAYKGAGKSEQVRIRSGLFGD